ncbi:hypothetical protein ACFQO4_10910 [Saliphagus sp. GCM10025334]
MRVVFAFDFTVFVENSLEAEVVFWERNTGSLIRIASDPLYEPRELLGSLHGP